MERTKSIFTDKVLLIAPNINASIITAGIMIQAINRRDISVFFVNNNNLGNVEVAPSIEKIYVVGIGEQNCEAGQIQDFIDANQEKICFWANNKQTSDSLLISIEACPNLEQFIHGNKNFLAPLLINSLEIEDIPEEWKETITALTDGRISSNRLAERIKHASYAAEIMEQYSERCVSAEIRKALINELLLQQDLKEITDIFGLSLKIEAETLKAIQRVTNLDYGYGLITQEKEIFDRNEVFGYFLRRFQFFAIQFRNVRGEKITEICADKNSQNELQLIAEKLKNNKFSPSFVGSKMVIQGNWENIQKIVIEKIARQKIGE